jgi:hypothetical protein
MGRIDVAQDNIRHNFVKTVMKLRVLEKVYKFLII